MHVETGQAVPLLSEWVLQVLLSLVTRLTVNVFTLLVGNRGFSIGIGDVTPGRALIREKEKLVEDGLVILHIERFWKGM